LLPLPVSDQEQRLTLYSNINRAPLGPPRDRSAGRIGFVFSRDLRSRAKKRLNLCLFLWSAPIWPVSRVFS